MKYSICNCFFISWFLGHINHSYLKSLYGMLVGLFLLSIFFLWLGMPSNILLVTKHCDLNTPQYIIKISIVMMRNSLFSNRHFINSISKPYSNSARCVSCPETNTQLKTCNGGVDSYPSLSSSEVGAPPTTPVDSHHRRGWRPSGCRDSSSWALLTRRPTQLAQE